MTGVMNRTGELPPEVIEWISRTGGDQALLIITVDGQVRPHVALLARDEVRVVSPGRLRVACGVGSRSAENLKDRSGATLSFFDADLACSIKTRVSWPPRTLLPDVVAADLEVEEVRLDTPRPSEGAARLSCGLHFEGRPPRPDIQAALQEEPPRKTSDC